MSGNSGIFTNGASLEDCHTNVFVLTELTGLSWKKFVTPSDQHTRGYTEICEDPILRAYGRCLSEGLLCVWRRAPLHDRSAPATGPSQIDLRLPTEKELFVFWYSDEPEILKTLTSSLTNPEGKGSWDKTVEYETRTLLFKALHNLIERVLFTKGFVRLGKWFVQPLDYESPEQQKTNFVLAFNFTFFVHGENNVCVCVNTQRQPPVYKISRRHFCQESEVPVIVAPWSLKGTFSPASYQSNGDQSGAIGKLSERQQMTANKQWKEWRRFYPLPEKDNKENLGYVDPVEKEMQERANAMALPQMLEVTVAGARMYFPTGFVLVVGSEDAVVMSVSDAAKVKQSPGKKSSPAKGPQLSDCDHWGSPEPKRKFNGFGIVERATEEMLLSRKSSANSVDHDTSVLVDEPRWEFRESTAVDGCGCVGQKPSPTAVLSKAALKFGAAGAVNQQRAWDKQKMARGGPFHRRSPLTVLEDGRQAGMGLEGPSMTPPIPPTVSAAIPNCASSIVTPVMDTPLLASSSHMAQLSTLSLNTTLHSRHVPETQMISPANSAPPPPQEQELRKSHGDLGVGGKVGGGVGDSSFSDVIVRSGVRKTTELKEVVKRPKLEDVDWVAEELRIEAEEEMDSNSLYPTIQRRLSLWHETEGMETTEHHGINDPIRGLIKLGDKQDETQSEDFLLDPNQLKKFLEGDDSSAPAEPEATLQKPDEFVGRSREDLALPDNIMAEDHPQIISPPASHENDDQFALAPTGQSAGRKSSSAITKAPAVSAVGFGGPRVGGPPSVGEYSKIYPTPPSLEPMSHQFSPEMPAVYLSTVSGSVKDSFSPTICGNSAKSITRDEEGRIFDQPKLGRYMYLASSKFFGTTRLNETGRKLSTKSKFSLPMDMEYKPVSSTIAQAKTPTVGAQAQSIFETQPGVSSGPGRGGGNGNLWGIQIRPQGSFTPNGTRPGPSPYACPQQSPSPLTQQANPYGSMQRTPRTPGGQAEGHSPLSQADSSTPYRALNSVEDQLSCHTGGDWIIPEAHSLVVTLLLSDTFVDIHRDASFDSCPLCACQCNIRGLEMGVYVTPLPAISNSPNLAPGRGPCTCGFSAVRHRYLSSNAGLFLEDELEATNCDNFKFSPPFQNSWDNIQLIELIRQQSLVRDLRRSVLGPSGVDVPEWNRVSAGNGEQSFNEDAVSVVEWRDLHNLCNSALEAACMVIGDGTAPARSEQDMDKQSAVHKWGYRRNEVGSETTDVESLGAIRLLSQILEEALKDNREPGSLESSLTWRNFERKCSRGSGHEDGCQPEPVPQILLTNEKDSLSVAPQSLRLWDRLLFEPYSQPKDVLYVAVIPENTMVMNVSSRFFRELSKTYESSKFGRHCPLTGSLRDGLIRVGKDKVKGEDQEVDSWGSQADLVKALGHDNWNRIKAYMKQCRDYALFLKDEAFDRHIFRDNLKENQPPTNEAMPPPPPPSTSAGADIPSDSAAAGDNAGDSESETGNLPYVLVVYMVNPIVFGAENHKPEVARVVSRMLLRCYLRMVSEFPKELRHRIQLEIVPIQTVLECAPYSNCDTAEKAALVGYDEGSVWASKTERIGAAEAMKTLAISVYSQMRSLTAHCLLGGQAKSLTGFGPAAVRFDSIQKRLLTEQGLLYKSYCTPFILAAATGTGEKRNSIGGDLAVTRGLCSGSMWEDSNVLFVSYCLSEGPQNWLLATATDHRGRVLENCLISLTVQHGRKFASHGQVIREGLNQLWRFVESVLALSCHPWRLVVGRLGRLGHSELKEWARLLSKSNLKAMKNVLSQNCAQCSQMPGYHETPAILSACLISTEPETNVRVYSRSFTHDERFGQGAKHCPLSTPDDTSCTHILVFPTSATISAVPMTSGMPSEDADELFFPDDLIPDDMDGLMDDILCPTNPVGQAPTSAGLWNRSTGVFGSDGASEELALQPLALGYYVSTAPAKGLPSWFWWSCPSARQRCPVHLKSALHLNISRVQESDEFSLDASAGNRTGVQQHQHPLDSKLTTDVLRYVLETYNALSWLNVDQSVGDRRSCLPVHIQALLRLYHSVGALV